MVLFISDLIFEFRKLIFTFYTLPFILKTESIRAFQVISLSFDYMKYSKEIPKPRIRFHFIIIYLIAILRNAYRLCANISAMVEATHDASRKRAVIIG